MRWWIRVSVGMLQPPHPLLVTYVSCYAVQLIAARSGVCASWTCCSLHDLPPACGSSCLKPRSQQLRMG